MPAPGSLLQPLAALATGGVLAAGLILGEGTLREKAALTRSLVLRWGAYALLDAGLMLLSLGLVAAFRALGLGFAPATAAMALFDLLLAGGLWWVCLRSGQDLTLGRAYRQSTDLLRGRSRLAGFAALLLLLVRGVVWDGPERVAEFLHRELAGRWALGAALLSVLAVLQALFWTAVYWGGFELWSRHA